MKEHRESNLKDTIGNNIVFLMSVYGKSRRDVARELDISYTTLTDWIKGNTYPRVETLEELGYYFRIEVTDFFTDITRDRYRKERLIRYAEELGVFLKQGESMNENTKLIGDDARELFRHKTLEERAEKFGGKLGPYQEMDSSEPVGREVWQALNRVT